MVHGTLLVEPAAEGGSEEDFSDQWASVTELHGSESAPKVNGHEHTETRAVSMRPDGDQTRRGSEETEDAEAAARRAEIRDLTRRIAVGAVLTAPVLFAVMASEIFNLDVPELLMNRWVQLALVTPVIVYTGWPIHRTGWLALRTAPPT